MAFAVKCGSNMKRASEGYGMGLVRSSSFGRKKVALSEICTDFRDDDCCFSTSKRQCFQDSFLSTDKSALENLFQEILIRILCGVEHDDLKRLFFVSNPIREATLIAKQTHFAYSTPRKMVGFRNKETSGDFNEVEAPNAPKQSRVPRFRLSKRNLKIFQLPCFLLVMKMDLLRENYLWESNWQCEEFCCVYCCKISFKPLQLQPF